MSKTVQMVRMPTSQASVYLGPAGQLVVDTNANSIRVHDGITPGGFSTLMAPNNLSDLTNLALARANLGVSASGATLLAANNLSDLINVVTARANLGLGTAAVENVAVSGHTISTISGAIVSGNIAKFTGTAGDAVDSGIAASNILLKNDNLASLTSASAARGNLGLGAAAVSSVTGAGVPLVAYYGGASTNLGIPVFANTTGSIEDSGIVYTDLARNSLNLSDLVNAATARTNLGLGSAATHASTDFDASGAAAAVLASSLQKSANLSDLASAATARTNLGVTSTGNDAAYAKVANNLSDLSSEVTARSNLGFGWKKTTAKTGAAIGGGQVWAENHSIGSLPGVHEEVIQLTCLTGDLAYSIGDVVTMSLMAGGSQNDGVIVGVNSTQIFWAIGSNGIRLIRKDGGAAAYITAASWSLVVLMRWEL